MGQPRMYATVRRTAIMDKTFATNEPGYFYNNGRLWYKYSVCPFVYVGRRIGVPPSTKTISATSPLLPVTTRAGGNPCHYINVLALLSGLVLTKVKDITSPPVTVSSGLWQNAAIPWVERGRQR